MEIAVKDACPKDVPSILEMEQAYFSYPHTEDQLLRSLRGPMHEFLAAESEEGICGYVGMEYVIDEGYISNIAVKESCRRCGIADALLAALKQRARELGLAFISLEVREQNLPAISLYEKNAFEKTGFVKNYYSQPADNAVIMTWFNK